MFTRAPRALLCSLAIAVVFLAALPSLPSAGTPPRLQWGARGGVNWGSGHVISFGTGVASGNLFNRNLRRQASLRRALDDATRSLRRSCLSIRVAGDLTLRDYLREDAELQKGFDTLLTGLSPWQIRFDGNDGVQVAMKVPLGGEGSLSELLGEVRGYGLQGTERGRTFSGGTVADPLEVEGATGIIILAPLSSTVPALRPRILSSRGEILVEYGRASAVARNRPALIAYHYTLERAREDPVTGAEPAVVTMGYGGERGTDLVIPEELERALMNAPEGRRILGDARIAVVLRD